MGKLDKNSLAGKIFSGIAVFAFAFFTSYLSSSHFSPVTESEAVSGTEAGTSTYYADISSSGSIDLVIKSTPDGVYKVGKDSLSIDTNSTLGYKLYISTEDKSSSSLPSTTPSNGLIDSATGAYISPSSGTVDTPVRLQTNTWGYTTSRANNTETSTVYVDSDAAPTEAKGGLAVWRAVPEYGDEDIFYVNSAPATASTNSVDVYYAVNASTALPSGTYSNTVVYTAIVEGNVPSGSEEITLSPTYQGGLESGEKITVTTNLYPGLNIDNLGDITVKIGNNDCANVTTSILAAGNLEITCDSPAQTTYGKYTVTIMIEKYGKTYTLTDAYTYIPKFYTITTMQEMTHEICTDSNVVTPAKDATLALNKDNYLTESGSLRAGIPTRTLLDDRAGQVSYTIKKLADGKCWMTQNLALPSGAILTAANSDLDGVKVTSYTIPASSGTFTDSTEDDNQMNSQYTNTTDDPRGYKTGNYYSWRSATAGTGRGSTTDGAAPNDVFGTNMNTLGNNTLVSICPKGWRLPTGGDGDGTTSVTTPGSVTNLKNGDFKQLIIAYGGTGNNGDTTTSAHTYITGTDYGPKFARSGAIATNGRSGHNDASGPIVGVYWTSTVVAYNRTYNLKIYPSYIMAQNGSEKYLGYSLRCVAR